MRANKLTFMFFILLAILLLLSSVLLLKSVLYRDLSGQQDTRTELEDEDAEYQAFFKAQQESILRRKQEEEEKKFSQSNLKDKALRGDRIHKREETDKNFSKTGREEDNDVKKSSGRAKFTKVVKPLPEKSEQNGPTKKEEQSSNEVQGSVTPDPPTLEKDTPGDDQKDLIKDKVNPKEKSISNEQKVLESDHPSPQESTSTLTEGENRQQERYDDKNEKLKSGERSNISNERLDEDRRLENELPNKIDSSTRNVSKANGMENDQKNGKDSSIIIENRGRNRHDNHHENESKDHASTITVNGSVGKDTVSVNESAKPQMIICRNTVQGSQIIADSRGFICSVDDIDPISQCCKRETVQYSCKTCNNYECCSVYEYCVSCCMDPQFRSQIREIIAIRKNEVLYANIKTVFQFCAARCRTSSKSIVNQKIYKTAYKHCFGKLDPSEIKDIEE